MKKKPAAKGTLLSPEEKAAMKEMVRERKAAANNEDALKDLLAKIAAMPPSDRAMAKKVHAIITKYAPGLTPKTWYGMPAYYKDGSPVCFFQDANKFKAKYATLGFTDKANLGPGSMWPTSYALTTMGSAEEAKIAALIKKAVR